MEVYEEYLGVAGWGGIAVGERVIARIVSDFHLHRSTRFAVKAYSAMMVYDPPPTFILQLLHSYPHDLCIPSLYFSPPLDCPGVSICAPITNPHGPL